MLFALEFPLNAAFGPTLRTCTLCTHTLALLGLVYFGIPTHGIWLPSFYTCTFGKVVDIITCAVRSATIRVFPTCKRRACAAPWCNTGLVRLRSRALCRSTNTDLLPWYISAHRQVRRAYHLAILKGKRDAWTTLRSDQGNKPLLLPYKLAFDKLPTLDVVNPFYLI